MLSSGNLVDLENKERIALLNKTLDVYWAKRIGGAEFISEAQAQQACQSVLSEVYPGEAKYDDSLFTYALRVMKFDNEKKELDRYELLQLIHLLSKLSKKQPTAKTISKASSQAQLHRMASASQ